VDPLLTDELLLSCDAVVVVIGLTSDARSKDEPGDACGCVEGDSVEGECCDRYDVMLPGAQLELVPNLFFFVFVFF
jgi:hypothetical protein